MHKSVKDKASQLNQPVPETHSATPTALETPEIELERDEFADPIYLDPNAKLPRIQALRGTTPKLCGYFVPTDQMAKAGWFNFDEKLLTTYTFEITGVEEQGFLTPSPRMLVCPRTPTLAYDRKASKDSKQLVVVGRYSPEYKDEENIGNTQYFEVILLDDKNQPLHQVPLSYRASGANQATFATHWQAFIDEMTACHAISNRIAARGKNNLFKCLCVFCFTTVRELAGTTQKSPACKVASHEVPSLETWKHYFVGLNQERKQEVWEALQPAQPLIVPGLPGNTSSMPQLPPAQPQTQGSR
ncbi:hypothetical protein H6S82_00890 [Planktothrix sp. FACHB-1355]|uniref:DUF5895 domain-containing protein n=1 Tax=Aerosakkonema funiforme FACHB-1375 TaxID=2949571 RepID=A0A926VB73_9CYAN|nr:hypothetical protein [Aerosakkonema funiforme FACHB-1375]MBD3557425.1 hypothetical protein [Planktothrix sp. FACHB-1355]